jgi:HlyD family secretion protein
MSVSAELETRTVTNALSVPYAAVTTRPPKPASGATNAAPASAGTNAPSTNTDAETKKTGDAVKPAEVVFVVDGERVKQVPVKIGITDGNHWEITAGLTEGQKIVSGSYKAVNKELEDGKAITQNGRPEPESK